MSAAAGNSDSAFVPRAVVAGVFLVALGTLFFEVLLTRIFSVTLWYHFGFLAISLALLGTAASAVLCFLYPDTLAGEKHLRNMAASAVAFAVAAPGSVVYHVVARLPGFDDLNSFYLAFGSQLTLLFIAFFSSGLCISIALFRYSSRIATVYSFDLIGASLGSMLVIPFMYQWSPMALVFVVSATAFVAALGFLRAASAPVWLRVSMALFVVASLSIGITNDRMKLVEISSVKSYRATQTQMPSRKPCTRNGARFHGSRSKNRSRSGHRVPCSWPRTTRGHRRCSGSSTATTRARESCSQATRPYAPSNS